MKNLTESTPPPTASTRPPGDASETDDPSEVPLFGARKRAKALGTEVVRLRGEVAQLRAELDRLGALSLAELERRRTSVAAEIETQSARLDQERRDALELLDREQAERREKGIREVAEIAAERQRLQAELRDLGQQVVETQEIALLQEAGVYEYRHPLTDAVAYQAELKRLRDGLKAMARTDGGAIHATTNWQVDGSAAKGRKMVRDFSKLMLRAYNAEADNLVRSLKPYKLASAIERLSKVVGTIERLGKTMDIRIADDYHALRVLELELKADYAEKLAEEKEREREVRERLREERKAQQEMERERARLEKERQHYLNAMAALETKGDSEGAARLREQLADVDKAIKDVDYRAANIRAGYVEVISNLGSFGERMVKIGMTRRLDPLDRVRELGDASVPFRYDVHALFFSDDAVGIEAKMHERLSDRRVNRVNTRREFFYATPLEVRDQLADLAGEMLQYEELAEALEFRQSQNLIPHSEYPLVVSGPAEAHARTTPS
jgi:hypothetical protein